MTRTAEKLIERRFDRMRLGQAVCEIETLLSDPEQRVALVPLTEAQYDQCLEHVLSLDVPETIVGGQVRDRANTRQILVRAIREPDDIQVQMFDTVEEMNEALEVPDINFLIDCYFEMVEKSSPALDGFSDDVVEELKKVLLEMSWSELSGRQWYALKRFLLSLGHGQLMDKSPGSTSTKSLIGTKNSTEHTPENADSDSQNPIVKSAESL